MLKRFKQAQKMIWADLDQGRPFDFPGRERCPDRKSLYRILPLLHSVLFHCGSKRALRRKFRQLYTALHAQLKQVLPPEQADEKLSIFLSRLPHIRHLIQTDLEAAYAGDPAATGYPEILCAYPGVYAVTVYRLAHELYLLDVPLIPRMMTELAHSATGIDIHPGATIGAYFFIDHGTGVVIGQTTVIGAWVRLYQGVTLGGISTRSVSQLRGQKRHPTIEDSVTVYAGASILGGDTVIGKGCVIGSNAFVTVSIPADTTVTAESTDLVLRDRKKTDGNI